MADEQVTNLENDFALALEQLLNKHGMDTATNTPDHILARHLIREIDVFRELTQEREKWYGVHLTPGQPMRNEVVNDNVRTQGAMGSETP